MGGTGPHPGSCSEPGERWQDWSSPGPPRCRAPRRLAALCLLSVLQDDMVICVCLGTDDLSRAHGAPAVPPGPRRSGADTPAPSWAWRLSALPSLRGAASPAGGDIRLDLSSPETILLQPVLLRSRICNTKCSTVAILEAETQVLAHLRAQARNFPRFLRLQARELGPLGGGALAGLRPRGPAALCDGRAEAGVTSHRRLTRSSLKSHVSLPRSHVDGGQLPSASPPSCAGRITS